MLFDKYRTCAATGSHGTFAFNPTAAWTAAITVAIVALAGFGRFEATLTRSRGYIIARHAWRCAVPACVALFFLQTMHLTNVVTAAGQMVLALAVVALCHCLFQFGRHATTRNPPASAVVYLVGGVSSALLVLGAVGSELVPRAYRSLPSHSMGAAMVAPGGPNMVPRTAPKRLRNGKSRNSYESADGSGLGESGDVGSGFGSEEVQAVGIAVPAAAPKEANPGSTQ
jgi:hypothetical protein